MLTANQRHKTNAASRETKPRMRDRALLGLPRCVPRDSGAMWVLCRSGAETEPLDQGVGGGGSLRQRQRLDCRQDNRSTQE